VSEGSNYRSYDKMGAHVIERDGIAGTHFAVWAPNARAVSVVGDFNGWREGVHSLHPRGVSGIWEGFIPGIASAPSTSTPSLPNTTITASPGDPTRSPRRFVRRPPPRFGARRV